MLDEAEVASLLDVPGDGTAAVRGRAILELLYATGIRCAELVGLDLGERRPGRAHGPRAGQGPQGARRASSAAAPRTALRAWLAVREARSAAGADALFLNARGGRLDRAQRARAGRRRG